MQVDGKYRDNLLNVVSARWSRFQRTFWSSPSAQTRAINDALPKSMRALDERTVRGWRDGQLPDNPGKAKLKASGYGAILDRAWEPADAAGRLAQMEAELAAEKLHIRRLEEDLLLARNALAGGLPAVSD